MASWGCTETKNNTSYSAIEALANLRNRAEAFVCMPLDILYSAVGACVDSKQSEVCEAAPQRIHFASGCIPNTSLQEQLCPADGWGPMAVAGHASICFKGATVVASEGSPSDKGRGGAGPSAGRADRSVMMGTPLGVDAVMSKGDARAMSPSGCCAFSLAASTKVWSL